MRVATLQSSNQALEALTARGAQQARLQSRITSGLRVERPSDDPAAAAQAELARSRLSRLAQDARATDLTTSVLSTADGALSRGTDLLQSAREAIVAAGNAGYNAQDRKALALTLRNARDQLLELANTSDGAGGRVFGGQGTSTDPFSGTQVPAYTPAAGDQRIGESARYPSTVDGREVFLNLPQGNGVFTTASAAANTGSGWIGAGSVSDASALTGHAYAVTIGGTAAAPTYTVTDTTAGTTLASNVAFTSGSAIDIAGQRVTISGTPATGDSFDIAPAGTQSVFASLDSAIALLEGSPTTAAYNEGLERAHAGLDRALDGMSLARTRVGEAMNAVQGAADGNAQDKLAVTTRRSSLQDLDLASAISDLQNAQVGSQAALKAYATLSKQTLFDLLS
ncbi:flagellar hook-associated protein FlgL [Ramlibacter humi]|uniref:Flagellar hook-associated protein 3 n=1 Tax=Ramlibacter humi TaxID=2530451 RepID=A0A4Z0C9V6_9BURK|nr:flagellar hook-associated protein FlgL [Ramlibacter humi]TFZ08383.1 flagellar hook-associated protein 3 [Ramlibacter humi]